MIGSRSMFSIRFAKLRRGILLSGIAVLSAVLFGFACSWNPFSSWKTTSHPSIVVILVENLGFGAFSCAEKGDSVRGTGFQAFCDEAVRFTHAYSPSILSQATLGSILTAKYPFEHGLRTNGNEALSAKEDTLAEVALAAGYKTSFFSGGPPIWRRSGVNQGFEVFDDNVMASLSHNYRGAPEVAQLFLTWQESEAAKDHFLSFLFFPDLQFIDAPTTNELGEVRESSLLSQVDAVDEGISRLVKELKKRKLWDSTEIFLVGMQADSPEKRAEEIPSMNLFSESTRITLMIKPSRKSRGGATSFNWKIDSNVSLVDVGATLFDLIGADRTRVDVGINSLNDISEKESGDVATEAGVYSLKSALLGPQPTWPSERMIISESAWSQWRGVGPIRAAIRQGPYFFLYDEPTKVFNTLTDNAEVMPLPLNDSAASQLRSGFSGFLKSLGFQPWKTPPRDLVEKLSLAAELWRDREPSAEALTHLKKMSQHYQSDQQLRAWRANWAVRLEDWTELKADASTLPLQPLWSYVAEKNLGEKAVLPEDPCLEFLRSPMPFMNPILPKSCRAEGLADLLSWANESATEPVRLKAMEQFLRFYLQKELAMKIAEHNEVVGRRWDAIPLADAPELLDLILSLPEMRKYKTAIKIKLKMAD